MNYVINNQQGDYYAGFQDGKPIWFRSRRKETLFDEPTADLIMRQLVQLGYAEVTKKADQ